eukprot:8134020-Lingulodinium_polyedra.AAC.1
MAIQCCKQGAPIEVSRVDAIQCFGTVLDAKGSTEASVDYRISKAMGAWELRNKALCRKNVPLRKRTGCYYATVGQT